MEPLHPEERIFYERALERRAEAIVRLARTGSAANVPTVLAMMVWNLLRAAIPLAGDQLRAEVFQWLGRQIRESSGFCPFCGGVNQTGLAMCRQCFDDCERDDRQSEQLTLLEHADEGKPQ